MTFTEAAAQVLRLVGKPLHYKEITDVAIERNLLSHVGKSPEVTMGARLTALVKKVDKDNPLQRVKPGVFALAEWDQKTIETGLADRTPALQRIAEREANGQTVEVETAVTEEEVVAAPSQEETEETSAPPTNPTASHRELDDESAPPDDEERRRAELSAAASQLFDVEEDDDQPIFGTTEEEQEDTAEADSGDSEDKGGRRRRRRRRRTRRDEEETESAGGEDLPGYTVSDAPAELAFELTGSEPPPVAPGAGEEEVEVGRGLANLVAKVLSGFDRSRGAVSVQNVVDSAKRKNRGLSDVAFNAGAVTAAVAADNLRAVREGRAPRFRLTGNRVALVEWGLDKRARNHQRALEVELDKVRGAVVQSLRDVLAGLPHRALGELVLVLLEQMGVEKITSVRRPGTHGSELHLQGLVSAGAGTIPTAILVRRDGKDIGRERITELRGALHHYGRASAGWIITTGQVLSGAREEARVDGAAPVQLIDGVELARLCVRHGVGVTTTTIEIPAVDVGLFDSLRG